MVFRYCRVDRQFMCDGNWIMGISSQAQIYAELEGKRQRSRSAEGSSLIEEIAEQLRHRR
jgi:hypothetical protein